MKKHCFIHTGRGRSLCSRHRREARELAKKWNISHTAAVLELRDFERAVEGARRARAREIEVAIRTVREHRAFIASRRSRSVRKRARD
jgi:hypothetical protein